MCCTAIRFNTCYVIFISNTPVECYALKSPINKLNSFYGD